VFLVVRARERRGKLSTEIFLQVVRKKSKNFLGKKRKAIHHRIYESGKEKAMWGKNGTSRCRSNLGGLWGNEARKN